MATATRARGRKAAAAKEETEEMPTSTAGSTLREPTRLHELMADYFNENYDAAVTPRQCLIFTSKRTEFRRSEDYKAYREDMTNGAVEDDEPEPTKKATTRSGGRRGRAAAKAEEEGPAETPAPAPRARRGRKPATTQEEPAEEKAATPARRARRGGRSAEEAEAPEKTTSTPARRRRSTKAAAEPATEEEPF